MTRLTTEQTDKLIEVLQLKHRRDGRYNTSWGYKSWQGLRETIENICNTDWEYKDNVLQEKK